MVSLIAKSVENGSKLFKYHIYYHFECTTIENLIIGKSLKFYCITLILWHNIVFFHIAIVLSLMALRKRENSSRNILTRVLYL